MDLLTPEQAAAYLHVRPSTIARWRWSGTGPCYVKIGGIIRYQRQSLDRYLQRREVDPEAPRLPSRLDATPHE